MTATRGSTTVYTILTINTGDVWRGGFLKRMLSMLLNLSFCTTPVGTGTFPNLAMMSILKPSTQGGQDPG